MNARTFQFIPGNNPSMLQSSQLLGADAIIIDLEDSVSIDEKDSARKLVQKHVEELKNKQCMVGVRINPTDSKFWEDDLAITNKLNLDFILVPKASVDSLKQIKTKINKDVDIIVLIESANSLLDIKNILAFDNQIKAALFGAEDYAADMNIVRTSKGNEIEWARNYFVINCVAQNKLAIDTPFTDSDDFEGLRNDTLYVKSIGFKSRSCVNPRHIDTIHEVLNPTLEEYKEAKEIVELNEQFKKEGKGVFSYKGKMVDLPIVKRCLAIIDICETRGLY